MPVSQVCLNVRAALAEIHKLKISFDYALRAAIESGLVKDLEKTEHLKKLLIKKIDNLKRDIKIGFYRAPFIRIKEIKNKIRAAEVLTRDDLCFIYENKVNNFELYRYYNDYSEEDGVSLRRGIRELFDSRDPEHDMLIIFGCQSEQVARSIDQINEYTKAYVGPLQPGVLQLLPAGVEYIYTEFPEHRIFRQSVEIGGRSARDLLRLLDDDIMNVSEDARVIMDSGEFSTLKNIKKIKLVRLSCVDLGLSKGSNMVKNVLERVSELGLELCPAEVAPYYLLKYRPITGEADGFLAVGMQQVPFPNDDGLYIFVVGYDERSFYKDDITSPKGFYLDITEFSPDTYFSGDILLSYS